MKLSREWLGDYTTITATDKEYADRMTMSGSKAEGYEKTGAGISGVFAGRVLEIDRHENSDHLWVCAVDIGGAENLTIVTGAQNVKKGDMVPVITDGGALPDGTKIKSGKLRGVLSQGMLCSLTELGLDLHDFPGAETDGIFILNSSGESEKTDARAEQINCEPGQSIIDVLGLGDSVIDFEITNNRPDCLSIIGLARESAATFNTRLTINKPKISNGADRLENYLSVEIKDSALCPRYTARMVKNIKIAPSPRWLRRRLRACGVRPINNIVDITNYVMLEYGQPMHAFDYSCVSGNQIIVRRAEPGESLETLDGTARALTPDMLVIADSSRPIGIAGVMGGANSEITENTKTIVFESACFNGTSIRKTALSLGMRTDASARFEKGLDINGTIPAVERACELIELLCAGEVIAGMADVFDALPAPKTIILEPERINALLGTDISEAFMAETLRKLEFIVDGKKITPPSFRSDIDSTADIAEEVARFYGYDKTGSDALTGAGAIGGYSEKQLLESETGNFLRSMGFFEILTYSFGGAAAFDKIRLPQDSELRDAFVIQNPLGEDSSVMRTTSLPSMLDILSANISKRNLNLRLYELATVYLKNSDTQLANEKVILTLGVYGSEEDFFSVKGAVEALFSALGINKISFSAVSDNPSYHPGRCAEIFSGDQKIGVMGQLHPEVSAGYDIEGETFAAEIDMQALLNNRRTDIKYTPLPRFPAITRDIAIVADNNIPVSKLSDSIRKGAGKYLEEVTLFDVYTGEPIPTGKRSCAFSLTFRSDSQTLTDEAADKAVGGVLSRLEKDYSAVLR